MAFDIYDGWPYGASTKDHAPAKADENIIVGMMVKKVNGEMVKADGSAGERAFFALDSSEKEDVKFSRSLPYLVGDYIVLTDQFLAAAYVQDSPLQVAGGGNAGKITLHAGGAAPIIGYYDGMVTRYGITFLKIISSK